MSSKTTADFTSDLIKVSSRKSEHVRKVFENPPRYLKSRRVDIRFRIDTVWSYASHLKRQHMLDIGCGDGTISLQLLTEESRLTLMDLSASMLTRARANIQQGLANHVELRNENFAVASFDSRKFDLIVAVGVMAHVDSPDAFLQKIKGLLAPGGCLILEFTDAYHVIGRIGRFWGWLKEIFAPAQYPTNKLSVDHVSDLLERNHFKVLSTFRYSRVPLPGFNRIVNYVTEYRLARAIFGNCNNNTNAWLGNEYIYLLQAE